MNTLNAIIFPDITPDTKSVFPLVHVFSSLVYCRPVENDLPVETDKLVTNQETCKIHVPAPLGDDRARFLQLINDLQNRRDDYASQLNHQTLAGMPSGSRTGSETKSSIVSSLLKSKGINHKSDQDKSLILWQARLTLKLGEMFDLEQNRLEQELLRIKEKQDRLFSELQGVADITFPLTEKISQAYRPTAGQQDLRLKAWSRLMFLGDSCEDKKSVFITLQKDDFDRLADEYEKLLGTYPIELITIPLPLAGAGPETSPSPAAGFKSENQLYLQQLEEQLETSGTDSIKINGNELLEKYYPQETHGRCKLTLYKFHKISAKQLFLNCFGKDEDLSEEIEENTASSMIIGYLENTNQ